MWLHRIGRALDWTLASAIGAGILLALMLVVLAAVRHTLAPCPIFDDQALASVQKTVLVGFALLWLAWAVSAWPRAVQRRLEGVNLLYGASLVFTTLGYLCWFVGLGVLNAVADLSPRVRTPIRVHTTFMDNGRDPHGHTVSTRLARVSRVDTPDEEVTIDFSGCPLPRGVPVSPAAELDLGRGALGVTWFSLPIHCRPLAAGDRPLYPNFTLGAGRPLILFLVDEIANDTRRVAGWQEGLLSNLQILAEGRDTVAVDTEGEVMTAARDLFTEDEGRELRQILDQRRSNSLERRKEVGRRALAFGQLALLRHDNRRLVLHWVEAIASGAADRDLEIAIVRPAGNSRPPLQACDRCRVLTRDQVDGAVLRLFLAGTAGDRHQNERVFLADPSGHRVFEAPLAAIEQEPRLLGNIAEIRR